MAISKPLVVAIGGAVGASVRWAADEAVGPTDWPWVLLAVNVVGSFLLGLSLVSGRGPSRELVRLGAGVGFCGGLTTFSAFALAGARLLEDGRTAAAAAFVAMSLGLGAAALVAGLRLRPTPPVRPAPTTRS